MATVINDPLNVANAATLSTRTAAEGGTTYTRHATVQGQMIGINGRVYGSTAGIIYANVLPASDYTVTVSMLYLTNIAANGIAGRIQAGAQSCYYLYHNVNEWVMAKTVGGTVTSLATYSQTLTANQTYTAVLSMIGSTISFSVDGTTRGTVNDASFGSGYAGFRIVTAGTTTTAKHFNNFIVNDSSPTLDYFSGSFSG